VPHGGVVTFVSSETDFMLCLFQILAASSTNRNALWDPSRTVLFAFQIRRFSLSINVRPLANSLVSEDGLITERMTFAFVLSLSRNSHYGTARHHIGYYRVKHKQKP
jgi:hypothetical protein